MQFRVGITLDFRGDVATSAALSLPRRPASSSRLLLPSCLAFCRFYVPIPTPFLVLIRRKSSSHPDYPSEIDPSARPTYCISFRLRIQRTPTHVHGYIASIRMLFETGKPLVARKNPLHRPLYHGKHLGPSSQKRVTPG